MTTIKRTKRLGKRLTWRYVECWQAGRFEISHTRPAGSRSFGRFTVKRYLTDALGLWVSLGNFGSLEDAKDACKRYDRSVTK